MGDRAKGELSPTLLVCTRHLALQERISPFARSRDREMLCHRSITRSAIAHAGHS